MAEQWRDMMLRTMLAPVRAGVSASTPMPSPAAQTPGPLSAMQAWQGIAKQWRDTMLQTMPMAAHAGAPAAGLQQPSAARAPEQPSPMQAWQQLAEQWRDTMLQPMLSSARSFGGLATSPAPDTTDAPLDGDLDGPSSMDRLLHAVLGRATAGLSPAALELAWLDWAAHMAMSPGKQGQLVEKAARKWARLAMYGIRSTADPSTPACIEPLVHDRRFRGEAWQRWPYNLIYQSFLLNQQWWHNATTDIRGVSPHHEDAVSFVARQLLDVVSPANFLATNPELLDVTVREGGQNLMRGALNFVEDWERSIGHRPPVGSEAIRVGRDVAITPGKVVYRNRLIELIQYAPETAEVEAEPILIVPAWIMKYYVLDLSPENSLVRYLVSRGHTVFMISWLNPKSEDRDLDMDDYLKLGFAAALDAVNAIVPDRKVDAVGYCLGGTLLSIGAAWLAREGDDRLASVTLLAAQTDFSEAGELTLFIDNAQLTFLEDIMWDQGYLDAAQMAGAFHLLRSNDLIWSRILHDYLFGERTAMTDLMAWNADTTRMPYHMHSSYLRQLYLHNDLAEGRFTVDGKPIALSDIRVPLFVVGTETDHVAPWRSVYKINLQADADITFVLTNGGHNAGVVSEPGHPRRHYRIAERCRDERYHDPDTWLARNVPQDGSWWPAWHDWFAARSSGRVAPPAMGAEAAGYVPLCDAPGQYVLRT